LSGDFETRSAENLKTRGLYKYAQHATTDIWCFSYAFDYEPVQLWQMGQPPPERVVQHVRNGGKFKAWNAQFERIIWNAVLHARYGWPKLTIEQTWCTMAQAVFNGYPASLDRCAEALRLNIGKDKLGHRLMMQMCRPRSQVNGAFIWWDDPDKRQRLGTYCIRDTAVERTISSRLRPLSDAERQVYILDQQINERGFCVDGALVENGSGMVKHEMARLDERMYQFTDAWVTDTRKRLQLLFWLQMHSDIDAESVDKYAVASFLRQPTLDSMTRSVLEIRAEAAKSSLAKLDVFGKCVCYDGRIHGTLQYYGAGRTGRWAGRLIQPHNFPKGHLAPADVEQAVAHVIASHDDIEYEGLRLRYEVSPLDLMTSLLRACIVAARGCRLFVADFAAIEARVLAWLAGELAQLKLFATGGDPYRVMASDVYRVPPPEVSGEQRWLGKQLVLGCGYQQGPPSFQKRLAKEGIDVDPEFAEEAIGSYRRRNPNIVGLWAEMQEAAMNAIRNPTTVYRYKDGKLAFKMHNGMLMMKLPSNRYLCYISPTIESVTSTAADGNEWTRDQIHYWGVDPFSYRWRKLYTYGGKLTENAVQAIARDVLAKAMLRVAAAGYRIILHVHDEIVAEVPNGTGDLAQFEQLMATVPTEMAGCPIKVTAWEGPRYRK
jgi:DNA polymerase